MIIYLNCDDNPTLNSWTKKIYLLEVDKRLNLNVFRDIKEIGDQTPDFVLNIQPVNKEFRDGKKWTGLWHIDCGDESTLSDSYPGFQTVFLASSSSLIKPDNSMLLFQAADPVVQKRIPDIDQKYDFVLCGSMDGIGRYDERRRRYDIMKQNFTYFDFRKGHLPHIFIQNYNHAKVQFIQSALSIREEGMCAQRFFECLAIGPVLCNWCSDLEHTGLIEGEDYMSFKTDEEMIEKMQLLLSDEFLRNKIAGSGRKKSLLYHTYDQRATAIINVVREFE